MGSDSRIVGEISRIFQVGKNAILLASAEFAQSGVSQVPGDIGKEPARQMARLGSQNVRTRKMKMIEQILGELQKFRSSDFFVTANIPPDKLRNAITHYPVPPDETVMALVDATVFGSAKNGMAFGHRGIYWKNDWTTDTAKNFLTWDVVMQCADSMTVKGGSLFLSPDCVVNLSGSQVKPKDLMTLFSNIKKNALTSFVQTEPEPQTTVEAMDVAQRDESPQIATIKEPVRESAAQKPFEGSYDRHRLEVVQAIAKRHRLSKNVHIAPAIKIATVKTILEVCGSGVDPYSILAVVDNTFFQTGKDFLIVTDQALIAKGMLRKVDQFALSEIREIRCHESQFYVNNHDFQCFDQLSDSEVMILCDFLRELIPALQRTGSTPDTMSVPLNRDAKTVQKILYQASAALQDELELDDEGKAIFGIFFDHVELIAGSDIVTRFDSSATLADRISSAAVALVLFYSNSMSKFPADFRQGMGETFFQIAGLVLGYIETLEEVTQDFGIELPSDVRGLLELLPGFFIGSEMSRENREFIQRVFTNSGARNSFEFLTIMLKQVNIPEQVCTAVLKKSDLLMEAWFKDILAMMEAED